MKIKFYLMTALLAGLANISLKAKPRLIGVFNGYNKPITILSKGGAGQFTKKQNVSPRVGKSPQYIEAVDLPAKIKIEEPKLNATYEIIISEEGKCKDPNLTGYSNVVAKVFKGEGSGAAPLAKYNQDVCINNTESLALGKGFKWQNLMIAFGPNEKYSEGSDELPFKFAISAWTTTKQPWNFPTIKKSPLNDVAFSQALTVMQGHNALGGGILPRLGHANIVNLYNDSKYLLMLEAEYRGIKTPFGASLYAKLIPPFVAIPWIMNWIPKIPSSDINKYQKSALRLFVFHPPIEQGDLPPDPGSFAGTISKIGQEEIAEEGKTSAEIKEKVQSIEEQTPSLVDEIMGTKPATDLMSDAYENYYQANYHYQIFMDSGSGHLYIQKCSPEDQECKTIFISKVAAFSGNEPSYFELLIKKPVNKKDQFMEFQLMPQYVKGRKTNLVIPKTGQPFGEKIVDVNLLPVKGKLEAILEQG